MINFIIYKNCPVCGEEVRLETVHQALLRGERTTLLLKGICQCGRAEYQHIHTRLECLNSTTVVSKVAYMEAQG